MRAILQALSYRRDVLAWRNNTGGARFQNKEGGRQYFVQFGRKGQADITGIVADGRRLEIEVKVPERRDELSEHQEKFGEQIIAMGGIWFVATSVDEAIEALEEALK